MSKPVPKKPPEMTWGRNIERNQIQMGTHAYLGDICEIKTYSCNCVLYGKKVQLGETRNFCYPSSFNIKSILLKLSTVH